MTALHLSHVTLVLLAFLTLMSPAVLAQRMEQRMLIGTNAMEMGIYACELNTETGEMSDAKAVGDAPRPGYLALHPTLPLVYAVTSEPLEPNGGVRAFRLASRDSKLILLGAHSTGDVGATHLAVAPEATSLVVVHYSGGSTTRMRLSSTGSIGSESPLVKHEGSSVNVSRQEQPHAHGVAFDADGRFACVADLGTDEVIVYRLAGGRQLKRSSAWKAKPGAGPRHLAFHPNGKWLYCINELDSTMSVLTFDGDAGQLSELQTLSTLPEDFDGENSTAEVIVHPSGKFVYGSNRGHDSTAVFSVAASTGHLTLVETEPTGGGHPRFIGLDPTGSFLIAANRDSDNLVSFHVDKKTGALEPTGFETSVPTPVCVVFPSEQ
ncbi:MAG: lactonase family protein [Aeoliella sp.]